MSWIVIALLFLSGCMQEVSQVKINTSNVDIAIEKFKTAFNTEINTEIRFDKDMFLGNNLIGWCDVYNNIIYLNTTFWTTQTQDEVMQALVFHELGHCVLGLVHTAEAGIMHDFIGFNTPYYVNDYDNQINLMKEMSTVFEIALTNNKGE